MRIISLRTTVAAILAVAASAVAIATEPRSTTTSLAVPVTDAPWQTYDAGRLRVLAAAESTDGRYAVLELNELPGYMTPPHRHPDMEESFYVLEGTLELRLPDKTHRLGAGSYVRIPRNTPHAQGSADDKPVRVLMTVSPGEFEAFFLDRVDLVKSIPREHADFQRRYLEIVRKHSTWLKPARWDEPGNEDP